MKKNKKTPGLLLSLVPIISMFLLLSFGIGFMDLPAEPLILISTLIAGLVALYLGYSFDEIMESISDKIGKVMPAILILVTVGFMIGAWIVGGTIPMLIYYGLKIISPEYLYLTAFVVSAIVAVFTGTSWGAAGSIGVAFMGVSIGMDANMGAAAGAVVAGVYFGDKMSPLSDTTNLAALSTEVDLFEHIRHMLYTTVPSFIVAGIVYVIAGFVLSDGNGTIPESIPEITNSLSEYFSWNIFVILPLLVILVGAIRKYPTIPVMLVASFIAMINGIIFQGFSLNDVIEATLNGFDVSMISAIDPANISDNVEELLNRGGMISMMETLLIALIAISFAGAMMVSNSLNVVIESLLNLVKSTFGLIASTIITCLATIGVTSNGQISILIPGEAFKDAYIERGLHPKNLSRTIEDSVTIIEPILPWTAAGAYMAGTLGVSTLTYLPWAVLNYTGIIFALIWAATGFGITKITKLEKDSTQDKQILEV